MDDEDHHDDATDDGGPPLNIISVAKPKSVNAAMFVFGEIKGAVAPITGDVKHISNGVEAITDAVLHTKDGCITALACPVVNVAGAVDSNTSRDVVVKKAIATKGDCAA